MTGEGYVSLLGPSMDGADILTGGSALRFSQLAPWYQRQQFFSSTLSPLFGGTVRIHDVRLVDGTLLDQLDAGLVKSDPSGSGVLGRGAISPGLVGRRRRRRFAVLLRARLRLLVLAWLRPRLLLARRKNAVERDSEEVNDAGDQVDCFPLGDGLYTRTVRSQ